MKKLIIAGLAITALAGVLTGCEGEDSGVTLKGQTNATMGKTVKHVATPKMANTTVPHVIDFNGKKIKLVATYGIDKRYARNWIFTNTEQVNLAIKPVEDYPGIKLGINNIYSDVSTVASKTKYNGVRQDSVNMSYSDMPQGMAIISKSNGYSLPFKVESINENETSFYVINGYGKTENDRITEAELKQHSYGAKLDFVWTVGITDKHGNTYLKTINDSIGIPYKREN